MSLVHVTIRSHPSDTPENVRYVQHGLTWTVIMLKAPAHGNNTCVREQVNQCEYDAVHHTFPSIQLLTLESNTPVLVHTARCSSLMRCCNNTTIPCKPKLCLKRQATHLPSRVTFLQHITPALPANILPAPSAHHCYHKQRSPINQACIDRYKTKLA